MERGTAFAKYEKDIQTSDQNILQGIISRESRAGDVLPPSGYGFDGHGYGLMQVDDRYHKPRGGPLSYENILQGTEILVGMISGVRSKHTSWTQDMVLRGGIAAYNFGVHNVRTYESLDVGTTGGDYSKDVTARAQFYRENGF